MSESRAWRDLGGVVQLVELDDQAEPVTEYDQPAQVVKINRARGRSKRTRTPQYVPPVEHHEPTEEGRRIIAAIRAQLRSPTAPAGANGGDHAS